MQMVLFLTWVFGLVGAIELTTYLSNKNVSYMGYTQAAILLVGGATLLPVVEYTIK